ncbi:bifunctional folylpolyglutamate synthase/dihydrofolate synthase [Brevibacillus daliensis]|uniref:bifunctional folylpolyglutamate synthase/dihydrofolate synthase n=1 Tax=Brevibacillus daliensis TaxID=2892995 RepID=UPI001E54FF75|nr:folylpolyglutamate synthase/dihydrofolate synthase family protein [Brevibacillus daliensis]
MKADHDFSYEEALTWLHGLLRFGQKPGLERMNWMLEELGHPQRRLMFVHVAGTNGKGSTCSFLTHVLQEAGISVGTFTSPYITDFRERIRYNNQMIPQTDLARLVDQIKPLVERCAMETEYGSPTEFEVITLLAICYFVQVRPAVVVWETGLGGRLDSTNVVNPLVTVITNIGLDHTDILGSTLEDIAYEKAGIIKSGVPVVLGQIKNDALAVIEQIASSKRSNLFRLGVDFHSQSVTTSLTKGYQEFTYSSVYRRGASLYRIRMLGAHQIQNVGVALMVLDLLRESYAFLLEEEDITKGLARTSWPGRLEIISSKPLCIIDGAHNTEGMEMLVASMKEFAPELKRLHLMFSALGDKPLSQMTSVLKESSLPIEKIYVTTFDFPRATSTEVLEDAFITGGFDPEQIERSEDWRTTLQQWHSDEATNEDALLVCGSLYFISLVRSFFPIPVEQVGE